MKKTNNDELVIDSTAEQTTDVVDIKVSTAKSPLSKLALFAILLILILAGFVGFGVDYYLKDKKLEQSEIENLVAKQVKLLANVDEKIQQQTTNNNVVLSQFQKEILAQQESQNILKQKMAEVSGRRPNDWLLAEANYLVSMAGRKLWQEKDQQTAVALLTTADQRLAEMNDESLITLRLALTKDISMLSALPKDQTQNVALTIDGLIAQIDNLKLNTITLPEPTAPTTEAALSTNDGWKEHLKKNWYALIDGFVKVRKHEGSATPLMSAKQQWYLEENLKNKLIQAQLAVYRKQQEAFSRSIGLSKKWVLQFFDREDSATQFMLETFKKLEKVNIDVKYPADLLSRNLISDELRRRNILSVTTATPSVEK